ncbi:tRNA-binding domain-containing CsaA-like protein [Ordospora colligata]|uniref:tRNA-binding domain-containing CsaA-like protein n=1 Tax=Ordospora colligata OC4 TaxID=1354746 RepID=A0A0B2ULR3_9MICR|nr:tRNA-binding domain-containing CsaA-like protein [Ordospora colligata OC4]KHN70002.1 tRNA-binding domain-containing CsaA-like protein [Ordospora colligata OC4]TBU16172.1 tRNA-binding domain-containing CsaA-like protein [Ordospora colligata]TBU16385.1 tRNA-binding domain-containing CsaA-like protein [Ordospora colligata]TBU19089.1 tRNA-binding domain-containing CsaA-like protein [Ordospora colligata]
MRLEFSSEFEDIAFVVKYFNRDAYLERADEGIRLFDGKDTHNGLDAVLKALYTMHEQDSDEKRIREAKRLRGCPEVRKIEICIGTLISFHNIYRMAILQGSLKNKGFIDGMAEEISKKMAIDVDIQLLDIQVGEIASVDDVPGLDKLYAEEVNAKEKIHVLSGLKEHVRREDLRGKKFLFVTNIKPIKFKGETSEGMILCAKDENGRIEPIQVSYTADNGARLCLENKEQIMSDFLSGKVDMKKSSYENVIKSLRIVDHVLMFKDTKVLCNREYIRTQVANGSVS